MGGKAVALGVLPAAQASQATETIEWLCYFHPPPSEFF
jgi:hypothetical protein